MPAHRLCFAALLAWSIATSSSAVGQTLNAFGAPPLSSNFSQIRSVLEAEERVIHSSRVCNLTVPLVGGANLSGSLETLTASAALYPKWEADYNRYRLLSEKLPSDADKRKYFLVRAQGVSADTIDIFTRTFLIRGLWSEGRHDQVVKQADELISKYHLTTAAHQVDQAEKGTYLTRQTSANIISFFSTLSRLKFTSNESERYRILTHYLDIRNDLKSAVSLFHMDDHDDDLLSELGILAVRAAKGELDEPSSNSIRAAWISPDDDKRTAYLIIKGKQANTIEVLLENGGAPPPPPADNNKGRVAAGGKKPPKNSLPLAKADDREGTDGNFDKISVDDIVSVTVVTAEKAKERYERFVDRQLSRFSTDGMALFDFRMDESGALITIGSPANATPVPGQVVSPNVKRVQITKDQLAQMHASPDAADDIVRQLVPASSETALVAYTNPFSLRTTEYRDASNAFSFDLHKSAKSARVYRDPLSARTADNVRALTERLVGRASDYIAYVDDGSFKLSDFNIVQDIKKLLTKAGIRIVAGVPTRPVVSQNKNVIVITAHSDAHLAEFVDALGNAGAFRGNFVLLNSCETPLTSEMADRIMQKHGAKAAFLHQDLIPAAKVQDLLVTLAEDIQQRSKRRLVDVFSSALRNVGLNGIWSICEIYNRQLDRFYHG